MFSTKYSSEIESKTHNGIFTKRAAAHDQGFYQAWELRRKGLKPTGPSRAILVDAVEATEWEQELMRGWDFVLWFDDHTIAHNERKLYHVSQTKPYRPTEHTKAVWRFQDVFCREWRRCEKRLSNGQFITIDARTYRNGLNEGSVSRHLRGKDAFRVFAGHYTGFVSAHVPKKHAKALLDQAEIVLGRLSAVRWFCQISQDSLDVFWLFPLPAKTEWAVAVLNRVLTIPAEIGPRTDTAVALPLTEGRTTITDRVVRNAVELVEWLDDPEATNMPTAEVVASMDRGAMGGQVDLLSIAYQMPDPPSDASTPAFWKNRTWRILTGFFSGSFQEIPLNTILIVAARLLHAEGLPQDEAEQLLAQWCRDIPNPRSSRLQPDTTRVLAKDIRRAVKTAYNGNGRQRDTSASDEKLGATVAAWRSKGLILSDRSTWGLTYGYTSIPEFELTDQERHNVEAYLLPLLSSRDTKGRNPAEVAVAVVKVVVRLVAAKERENRGLSVEYFQKYIQGETGVSCGNRNKTIRLIKALHDLGFVKTLRLGRREAGATRYGLAGRLADLLGKGEQPAELQPQDDLDRRIEETVVPFAGEEDGGSANGSIIYCVSNRETTPDNRPPEGRKPTGPRLTQDPIFNQILLRNWERRLGQEAAV